MGEILEAVARKAGTTVEEIKAGLKEGRWIKCPWCELPLKKTELTATFDKSKKLCEPCAERYWETFLAKSKGETGPEA